MDYNSLSFHFNLETPPIFYLNFIILFNNILEAINITIIYLQIFI